MLKEKSPKNSYVNGMVKYAVPPEDIDDSTEKDPDKVIKKGKEDDHTSGDGRDDNA